MRFGNVEISLPGIAMIIFGVFLVVLTIASTKTDIEKERTKQIQYQYCNVAVQGEVNE